MKKYALCCLVFAIVRGIFAREAVVLVEAHPDDLAGHGGTAILLAEKYDVHVIDYTHGEWGLDEKGARDGSTKRMRKREEENVCAYLGAKLHWMDEVDSEAFASRETTERLVALLKEIRPRAVILHWPVDIHCDHVMSAAAAWRAILFAGLRDTCEVYFHEQTIQSRTFRPSVFVDITRVKEKKDRLISMYKCQWPDMIVARKHDDSVFWGRRVGVEFAEAFAVADGTIKGLGVLAGLNSDQNTVSLQVPGQRACFAMDRTARETVFSNAAFRAEGYAADWRSIDARPTPSWWTEAKFGIFVHWGPYAVPAFAPIDKASLDLCYSYAEHYQHRLLQKIPAFVEFNEKYNGNRPYGDFAAEFKAEHFDAAKWAELFRRSGAKYAVLTSKHHDGFALWPSAASSHWNAVDAGPKRDVCREFVDAMHGAGLRAGFYYSLLEYGNPMYENERMRDKFVDCVNMTQLKELADDYGADIIWPDGEWFDSDRRLRSEEYLAWLFNESKVRDTVVVNDRWGKGCRGRHGGHYTTEYGFESGEITDGEKGRSSATHPWEECRGLGLSFGYNRFERAEDYLTAEAVVELLVRVVSGGGNLLLNVGPDRHGLIPPIMEERLLQLGSWLAVNGEAIYGTSAWRKTDGKKPADGVYYTRKNARLHAIQVGWRNEPFRVSNVGPVRAVRMLGTDAAVTWRQEGSDLIVTPPRLTVSELPCLWAWTYAIDTL